ncbi:MAG: hypothetical protein H6Q90_6500 [Deltaproteobacteria bacterium]|nr:hypothetical protein [Deltaproteobacteria bacterium]
MLSACTSPAADGDGDGGGGKSDDPGATFKDVVTEWEFPVGSGGDAWVDEVTIVSGGGLLATSTAPDWLRKLTPDGKPDETWGLPDPQSGIPGSTRRSGFLDLPAHEVWQLDGDRLVASSGDGDLFELRGYLANGTLDPAFGAAGRIDLFGEGHPLRVAQDADRHRFLVAFARAWETFGFSTIGPSKIEVLAYDQETGERSSIGTYDLPPWDNDGTNPATIHQLLPRNDDSLVLLVSETVHIPNPARADVATQWSTIRLAPGQPPQVTHIAVTSFGPRVVAFESPGGGGFDLYLWGTVDGISMAPHEEKLVRVSVDDAGAAEHVVLEGADLSKGCASAVATSTRLVLGQSIDPSLPIQFAAYPKSGEAPITFASDLPERCLSGLTLAPNGRMYGGTVDTSGTAWVYQVTSFAPSDAGAQ